MIKSCDTNYDVLPNEDEILHKPEDVCPVKWAVDMAETAMRHSCGKGTVCRDGLKQLYLIGKDIMLNKGSMEDIELLQELCNNMKLSADCELSAKCIEMYQMSLEKYYDEWTAHVLRKKCKAGKCEGFKSQKKQIISRTSRHFNGDKSSTIAISADGKIHLEADIVVVAAGMSGLTAATQAQEILNSSGGGHVIAFEKSGTTGGAANMGMAFLAIESQMQKENMTNDYTKDDAFNFFMEYTHWRSNARLVRRWFNMSAGTVDWVKNMGIEFQGVYKYFKNSHCTQHMIKVPGTNKPTERCASVMVKTMTDYALELGVDFQFHTAVKELIRGERGQILGVRGMRDDGTEVECLCSAVIVATGGMGNNVDMIQQYMGWKWGEDMFTFRIPGLDGDGMKMVWAAGGKKAPVNMEVTYNTPGTTDVFKTLSETMRQPNLLVNLDGKRFFNEELMDNTTYTGNALLQQKKHCAFSIIDEKIVDYYKEHGLDYITYHHAIKTMDKWEHEKELYFSGAKSAAENSVFSSDSKEISYGAGDEQNFWECQSLEEVAEVTGINLENLKKTIEEYNAMCNGFANGYDWQFTKDHRFLKPITTAPYYVARHFPSGYGSLGGIQVNENMEVLNNELDPIPGLYSCGTDSATVFADSYCFYNPGSTMSYALNSGRIAAMESTKYIDSENFVE